MFEDDIATNKAIGQYGAECILLRIGQSGDNQVRILTHCNTGSLATAGYGTALGKKNSPCVIPSFVVLLMADKYLS
ncbi:hypothetical protein DPMN_083200 [Dreissena polymorpha]|uniref:Uncharacterized protein n=1 Tax=Dreissena polymorpha TaxID=45954 RepID=A0A9D3Y9H9_DREPO|nr:hypothetical protein DPMN_083200 [Dreissena polymorpha]